jgi:hypothetical protein
MNRGDRRALQRNRHVDERRVGAQALSPDVDFGGARPASWWQKNLCRSAWEQRRWYNCYWIQACHELTESRTSHRRQIRVGAGTTVRGMPRLWWTRICHVIQSYPWILGTVACYVSMSFQSFLHTYGRGISPLIVR